MKIEMVEVGDLACNCYILSLDNHVLVIDPGDEYDRIMKVINNREIDGVLITHYHFDHVGALSYFNQDIIYDKNNLEQGMHSIGNFTFEVIYNPGHKMDAVSYLFDNKYLFCGDFLFYESIGRTDIGDGNILDMYNSLKETKRYSDDVIIYPGHGRNTNFKHERQYNAFLKKAMKIGDKND